MKLNELVKQVKQNDVKTCVTIGDSDFEFIVHTTVDDERASLFGNYVVNDVLLRDAAYRPDRMNSALMAATLITFTDIDFTDMSADEMYTVCYNTGIYRTVESTLIHSAELDPFGRNQLSDLTAGVYKLVEYYLKLSEPNSVSDEILENLNGLVNLIRDTVTTIAEKVEAFDLTEENIGQLTQAMDKISSIDDQKIISALAKK